jgi:hypothetical protein
LATIVGNLKINIAAGTAELTYDLDQIPGKAKRSAKGVQDAFNGIDVGEARGSIMVIDELIGAHVPRHVAALISKLPLLGAALNAAFPILAVIAMGKVIVEVAEHLAKLSEEAKKAAQDQVNMTTAINNSFDALDIKLLEAGIRIDELAGNHMAALVKQLKIIDMQTMDDLARSFDVVSKTADKVFEELKGHMYSFGIGSDGAKNALEEFKTKYDSLLAQGKGTEASDLLAGTLQSAKKVLELQHQFINNQTNANTQKGPNGEVADYNKFVEAHKALDKLKLTGGDDKELKSQQALVDVLNSQAVVETKIAELKKFKKDDARAKEVSETIASFDKEFAAKKQASAAEAKEAMAGYQLQFEQGKISAQQLADLNQAAIDKEYEADKAHLERLRTLNKGRVEALKPILAEMAALEANHAAEIINSYTKALEANRKGINELEKINTEQHDQSVALQTKESDAVFKGAEIRAAAMVKDSNLIQAQGSKKIAIIDEEIRNLERLKAQYKLTGQAKIDVDNAIHKLVLQRQKDQIDELLSSKKLGDNFHGTLLKMATDGQNWHTKLAEGFNQSVGAMNQSLAQFVTTGRGNFASLAEGAASSFINMALSYGESKLEMWAIEKLFGTKKAAANAGMAQSNTAVAATEALASVPFPANIAAAGETEALGQAFSAGAEIVPFLERGGIMGDFSGGMPAILHKKEMVLPERIASKVINMADGGGVTHNHKNIFAPTIQVPIGSNPHEFEKVLNKAITKWTREQGRAHGVS